MKNFKEHLCISSNTVKIALTQLNNLGIDAILFIVNEKNRLLGSLTDGDIRRGLISGKSPEDLVTDFIQSNPKFLQKDNFCLEMIIQLREANFKIIPVVDKNHEVIDVINFRYKLSYLPVDAVIMAGGKGTRLRPMTLTTPKPLLKVGDKAIIEHNVDRLIKFGIDDFWISINYLGDQLIDFFKDGSSRGVTIDYLKESEPLGTVGAVRQVDSFQHEHILITNSDILTNLNYEDFYLEFLKQNADMAVVTIPYQVNVPYAVLQTENNHVISFQEKPTYTYYSNGGIYLLKKSILEFIPRNTPFNATDLMEKVIQNGGKLISFPMRQYWLDIGKPEDFSKAQEDIQHLEL